MSEIDESNDDEVFEGDDSPDGFLTDLFKEMRNENDPDPDPPAEEPRKKIDMANHSQWALGGNGRFSPVGATVKTIPAGIYTMWSAPGAWGLELQTISSDEIYILPDMATDEVLKEVHKFWESESKYRNHNLLYKRGILLWGAPGSGKTVAVKLLMNEIVRRGGIVLIISHVGLAIEALKSIRRIEPTRHIIAVFEDIDEIIYQQGEANVLSMLDGEANVDNILNLATTNYPEKLGARIANRPSRFDRKMHVPMPSDEARKAYLQKATKDGISSDNLDLWIKDTKGMSIAHLRELVAAVYCLEQPYADVIARLVEMAKQIEGETGFATKRRMGLSGTTQSGASGW